MLIPVLLSAGLSSRMGKEKLLLDLGGKTIFERSEENILSCFKGDIVNVYRRGNDTLVSGAKRNHNIVNPNPERGISSSIALAVKYARENIKGCDGLIFFLADEPFIKKETIERVADSFGNKKDRIVLPRFDGRPGHPVAFGSGFFGELLKLKGDSGGKSIIKRHPGNVIYVPGDKGCVEDIDTMSMYEKVVTNGFKV